MKKYFTAILVVIASLLIERELGLTSLTIWLLFYFAFRRGSTLFLMMSSLILDLFFSRPLGSTPLLISIGSIGIEYITKRAISGFWCWLFIFVTVAIWNSLIFGRIDFTLSYVLVSLFFLVPFIFRVKVAKLFGGL